MDVLIPLVSLWCVFAVIGYFIGKTKGRQDFGLVMGFLFGPIGWVIVLLVGERHYEKCRWCSRPIRDERKRRCACGKLYVESEATTVVRDPVAEWEIRERAKQGALPPPPGWKRPDAQDLEN